MRPVRANSQAVNISWRHRSSRFRADANHGIDLYFAMVKKMTVYDDGRILIGLLDGTHVECEME